MLGEAAAVVITAPLTAETEGLLGAPQLAKCRDGCNVVNVGRAEIVDEGAIWREVSSGRLAYAADVWWHEPKPEEEPPPAPEPLPGSILKLLVAVTV